MGCSVQKGKLKELRVQQMHGMCNSGNKFQIVSNYTF